MWGKKHEMNLKENQKTREKKKRKWINGRRRDESVESLWNFI